MDALFLGAGFSKWAIDGPLLSELFDFRVTPKSRKETERLERVRFLKSAWGEVNRNAHPEKFIADTSNIRYRDRRAIMWYISKRVGDAPSLAVPFDYTVWLDKHPQTDPLWFWRPHTNRWIPPKSDAFFRLFRPESLSGIITTNYDLLIEQTLGPERFNYGFGPEQLDSLSTLKGDLTLAKIHGSVSWSFHRHSAFPMRSNGNNVLIVAPTRRDEIPVALDPTWRSAARILEQAQRLIVFGFSFGVHDHAVSNLLAQSGMNIKVVLLIDPNPRAEYAHTLFPKAEIQTIWPPPLPLS